MRKIEIKEVISNILYLNSIDEIQDDAAIFSELGLSSIDYIDLCFELAQKYDADITPDNLWPINKMVLDKKYYVNSTWTDEGLALVCQTIGLPNDAINASLNDLHNHFTVNFLDRRIEVLM